MATQKIADRLSVIETTTSDADVRRAHSVRKGVLARLSQLYCGLHGHDNLMHFEKKRVYLQCASCGHETPGWTLTEMPPKTALVGDSRRHVLTHPHLVGARRIA
jgi:hypothetical protein